MKVWIKSEFDDDLRTYDVLMWNRKPYFDEDGLIDEDKMDEDWFHLGNICGEVFEEEFGISPFDCNNEPMEVELIIKK